MSTNKRFAAWALAALILSVPCLTFAQFQVAAARGLGWAFERFIGTAPLTNSVLWLGRVIQNDIVLAKSFEYSAYAIGGGLAFFSYHTSDFTGSVTQPIKAVLVVSPDPAAKRSNPDTKRFDDATSGRNPTPKASYPGEATTYYGSTPTAGQVAASMAAGSTSSMTVPGTNTITNYLTVAISTYAGTSDSQKCAAAQTATNPGTGWSWTCVAGQSSDGKTVGLWYKTDTKTCAAGYTLTSGNCVLTDAPSVKKTSGKLVCEVIANSDGTWDVDALNPACDQLQASITKNGKKLTINKGNGTYDEIEKKDDGGTVVRTGNRTLDMDKPGGDGNSPVKGVSDSTGNGGSGNGSGSSGTSGSGGGSCGGTGQVACAVTVDDGSFQGKDTAVGTAADAVGTKRQEYNDAVLAEANKTGETFGLNTSWIPSLLPGAPVSCQNLRWEPSITHGSLAGLSVSEELDWCSKVDIFREYYAWLFGVGTVIAIAMLFFGSNGNTGRPDR